MSDGEAGAATEDHPRSSLHDELADIRAAIQRLEWALRQELDQLRADLRAQGEALSRRFEDADVLEVSRVNDVHGRVDVTRADLAGVERSFSEKIEQADRSELERVNGVHGRVDVTRAEFLHASTRLTEAVGESHHRMSLITAEVQRATDLFDLKLAALEGLVDQGLQAVGRLMFDPGEGAGNCGDQGGARNGSDRDSA